MKHGKFVCPMSFLLLLLILTVPARAASEALRVQEQYGLSEEAIEFLQQHNVDLSVFADRADAQDAAEEGINDMLLGFQMQAEAMGFTDEQVQQFVKGLVKSTPNLILTAKVVEEPLVLLNGQTLDSTAEYPLLVYHDITYFPMTYHLSRFMGLSTGWDRATSTLSITQGAASAYVPDTGHTRQSGDVPVTIVDYPVIINGTAVDNSAEEWPLFNYNGVTYFPLTWEYAVDTFGWSLVQGADGRVQLTSTPAESGLEKPPFPGLEWGMTPEEVCSALSLKEGEYEQVSEPNGITITVKTLTLFGEKCDAGFNFSPVGDGKYGYFRSVVMLPASAGMEDVKAAMTQKYGEPDADDGVRASWTKGGIRNEALLSGADLKSAASWTTECYPEPAYTMDGEVTRNMLAFSLSYSYSSANPSSQENN